MAIFNEALVYTLANEGSAYTNTAGDKGGPTRFGITLATLSEWHELNSNIVPTAKDVEALTVDQAGVIYKDLYWDVLGLDLVQDQAKATALFDIAVNNGKSACTKFAQHAVGMVGASVDGVMGDGTRAAINRIAKVDFFFQFVQAVLDHYVQIVIADPTQLKFFSGWTHRAERLILLMS